VIPKNQGSVAAAINRLLLGGAQCLPEPPSPRSPALRTGGTENLQSAATFTDGSGRIVRDS
jgi:hypothetical protein